jgi:hypothetical protein
MNWWEEPLLSEDVRPALSPKASRRRAPNFREKLACALLHIRKGEDNWLVSGDLRNASAKDICSAIDFDHIRRWAEDGDNRPQNLQPLMRADHREKSKRDNTEIAKGKRIAKKEVDHRRALEAKAGLAKSPTFKPKAKIPSRPFLTPEERNRIKERYAR